MNKLINGDCLEEMKSIPDKSIDMVFTSPPYNIGKSYESIIPVVDYIDWSIRWINELQRVVTNDGAIVINVGYLKDDDIGRAIPITYYLFDKFKEMYLQQEIVWNYGAGVACRNYLSPRNEKILWYVSDKSNYTFNLDDIRDTNVKYPNQKKNGKLRCNPLGKNPTDVWSIPKVTSGTDRSSKERVNHPAQTPLQLVSTCISAFSNRGDVILDLFMGSGTTGVASKNLNRDFIGIELDKTYFDIAKERISAT